MPSQFDSSEFVDTDFVNAGRAPFSTTTTASPLAGGRAPTREEIESKVSEAQLKLAELKRAQEELERERAALEETRRRQIEFKTGREEMLQALTRGVGLLEQAEFSARLQAEQMAKTMAEFREALERLKSINEEGWTKENYSIELTRATTTIENARMEWNSARLKFPILSGETAEELSGKQDKSTVAELSELNIAQLCKLGFALTWPLLVVGLGIVGLLAVLLLRH